MSALSVIRIGPSASLQDLGRPGYSAFGLSRGGAVDRDAVIEGAQLLSQSPTMSALEMAGFGGEFLAQGDVRIALTGAPMTAKIDDEAIAWNVSHLLASGQRLSIGAATSGLYGYLHVGGGLRGNEFLESCSAHLTGGVGSLVAVGDLLQVGPEPDPSDVGQGVIPVDRFSGGEIRLLPSVHTSFFSKETIARFEQTSFHRTPRGNRQGVELAFDGAPFAVSSQLHVVTEPMVPGDIQMTGDGMPYVLLPECQTSGGYPRIGTIVPQDLARVGQASPGVPILFKFVSWDAAVSDFYATKTLMSQAKSRLFPLIRDPSKIRDLLKYQLISGVIAGTEDETH